MSFKGHIGSTLLISSLLGIGSAVSAQLPADNTAINQRDQNANEATADRQKENRSERDITQRIRKGIMLDKSLSTYAHNVKIVTQNGQVTLKGPVRSEDEKRAVEAKAAEVVGENKVTSQLDIKPNN